MANALALAAVTAVLRDRLNDGLLNANLDSVGQFSVTSSPPDRLEDNVAPTNRLNIYLWNATRNAAWANERLPARSRDGARTDNPLLALDLHYILTATGAEDLDAEILLGYGMQVLHETPVLTKADIRASLGGGNPAVDASLLPAPLRLLAAADLADQFEQIRITTVMPESNGPGQIEMLSNIWSAFSTPLRASALYQVSCILIESRQQTRPALPVLTIGGHTGPLRNPRILRVSAIAAAGENTQPVASILPGGFVAIEGAAMKAELMRVVLGERELTAIEDYSGDRRIDVQIPADQLAGIARIIIHHLHLPGPGQAPRLWESSNAFPIFVVPVIASISVTGGAASGRFSGEVRLALAHHVGTRQRVTLLFHPLPGGAERAFSMPGEIVPGSDHEVRAALDDVRSGHYVLRVEIDGAASVPEMGPQGFNAPVAELGP